MDGEHSPSAVLSSVIGDESRAREVNAWVRCVSGARIHMLAPSPLDYTWNDLALGLSREVRWNGQTRPDQPAYSVAQHSVMVRKRVETHIPRRVSSKFRAGCILGAMLHDGAEMVLKDFVSPLKAALDGNLGDREYDILEERHDRAINLAAGLPAKLPLEWKRIIKRADFEVAVFEAYHLAGWSYDEIRFEMGWRGPMSALEEFQIEAVDEVAARQMFLDELAASLRMWSVANAKK